jgi:hypothetical protein
MRGTVVVAGSVAQRPGQGGHAWVFLQYLLGFRRLGWNVLFLDRLEPKMCRDARGRPCRIEDSENMHWLRSIMDGFGLGDSFAVLHDQGRECLGLPRERVLERTRDAELLLNVMGFLDDDEILGSTPRRVFLDIDPGFGHMWLELGLANIFQGHDLYVTIGENIGRPACAIPTCGLEWITSPQPVVLEAWATASPPDGGGFASIGAWRGPFAPIEYRGRTYGLRVHEFRKFLDLPRLSGQSFTLALDIHPAEDADIAALRAGAWSLVDPGAVAADPWAYRDFIHGAMAEFMVAKNMYVEANSGWFSDRSLCFLASGRPVLAQDTGLAGRYPLGEGLITFSTLDEAVDGARQIASDPTRHGRAARDLAREYFDSDRVLTRLLDSVGVA